MRDPLCPWSQDSHDFAFAVTGEPCNVCAALSRARAETAEACAKWCAENVLSQGNAGLCWRPPSKGMEDCHAGARYAEALRSLSPSAAAPTNLEPFDSAASVRGGVNRRVADQAGSHPAPHASSSGVGGERPGVTPGAVAHDAATSPATSSPEPIGYITCGAYGPQYFHITQEAAEAQAARHRANGFAASVLTVHYDGERCWATAASPAATDRCLKRKKCPTCLSGDPAIRWGYDPYDHAPPCPDPFHDTPKGKEE